MKTKVKSTMIVCFLVGVLISGIQVLAQQTLTALDIYLNKTEVELCLTMSDTVEVVNDTSFRRFRWQIYEPGGGAKGTWILVTLFNSELFPDANQHFLPIPGDLSLNNRIIRCQADTSTSVTPSWEFTSDTVHIEIINQMPISGNGRIDGPSFTCYGVDTLSYTVKDYLNASYYLWTIPPWADTVFVSHNADSIAIAGNAPASGGIYQLTVTPQSVCGAGKQSAWDLTVIGAISTNGYIAGDSSLCKGFYILEYAVLDVQNAQNYEWIIPTWATIDSVSASGDFIRISGNANESGTLSVIPSNYCETADTIHKQIQVFEELVAGNIGKDTVLCFNTTPGILGFVTFPSGAGGSYSYQWQDSTASTPWTNIALATEITYTPGHLAETHYFRVRVSADLCNQVMMTNTIRILVYPIFDAGMVGHSQVICANTAPDPLQFITLPSGGTETYAYQWYSSPDGSSWSSIAGANENDYQPPLSVNKTYFQVEVISVPVCGEGRTNMVFVEPRDLPVALPVQGARVVCRNQLDERYMVDPTSGYLYFWYLGSAGLGTFQAGQNTNITYIHWGNIEGTDTLYLMQMDVLSQCKTISSVNIQIASNEAPQKTEIVRKPNSNLLICNDISPNLNYKWGFIPRSSGVVEFIPDGTHRYVMLPHTFDSLTYIYFVDTYFEYAGSTNCITRSYMNSYSLPIEVEEYDESSEHPLIFPNPSYGAFKIYFPPECVSQDLMVQMVDLAGRLLYSQKIKETDKLLSVILPPQIQEGTYLIRLVFSDLRIFTSRLCIIK